MKLHIEDLPHLGGHRQAKVILAKTAHILIHI